MAVLLVFILAAGIALMAKGGDVFVDGAARLAGALKVPQLLIGATVVAVGTTVPELLTSLTAMIKGVRAQNAQQLQEFTDVAVGNAVGSMVCNIGLILALSFVLRPYAAGGRTFAVKGLFLLAITAAVGIFAVTGGGISVGEGVALLAFFALFLLINVKEAARGENKRGAPLWQGENFAPAGQKAEKKRLAGMVAAVCFGALTVAAGALFTVESVSRLCTLLQVPARVVSVTVVALGTSLPELVTAVTSARKGTGEMSLGNILGANVINGTLLLGLSSLISGGLTIDPVTRRYTLWFALALTAALVFPVLAFRRTSRLQGAALGALYVAAIVLSVT